jgi:hypothetical protein
MDNTKPLCTGNDLRRYGYKPGPLYKIILRGIQQGYELGLILKREKRVELEFANAHWPK